MNVNTTITSIYDDDVNNQSILSFYPYSLYTCVNENSWTYREELTGNLRKLND